MFSALEALPNELLIMLTTHLSPGSITAVRQTNSNLRARIDEPLPFDAEAIHEVENEPANKAARLFVCEFCHSLRSASQFELLVVARDMADAFTESRTEDFTNGPLTAINARHTGSPRLCVSCCVDSSLPLPGPRPYGTVYSIYHQYNLVHPVKVGQGWDWEYAMFCEKCKMFGKQNTDCGELGLDWCDGCIKIERKRLGDDKKAKEALKRKRHSEYEDEREDQKPASKKVRRNE